VKCAGCGHENAEGASTCVGCGEPLVKSEHMLSAPSMSRSLSDERLLVIVVLAVAFLVVVPVALYLAFLAPEEEPEHPSAVMTRSEVPSGFKFTIADVNGTVSWLHARVTLYSDLVGAAVGWQDPSSGIAVVSGVVWFGGTIEFGDMNVTLELKDIDGDGLVDVGDFFTIVAEPSGFVDNVSYYVEIRAPFYISSLTFQV